MRVSIIIPTYRRHDYLLSTLRGVLNTDYKDFEVIVADQTPADSEVPESLQAVFDYGQSIRFLRVPKRGVVAARHEAVACSTGDILLFLDDDIALRDDKFIQNHVANYIDDGIDAVVGREVVGRTLDDLGPADAEGLQGPAEGRRQRTLVGQCLEFPRDSRVRQEVCCFCTCNSSVRRSAFMAIGGFDENFAGASYGDDYDFAVRLVAAGKRIVFDPKCEVLHLKAPRGGLRFGDDGNSFSERDKALSGLIFYMRYARDYDAKYLLYHYVLRRTVLLRRNVYRPYRLPIVLGWPWLIGTPEELSRRGLSRGFLRAYGRRAE